MTLGLAAGLGNAATRLPIWGRFTASSEQLALATALVVWYAVFLTDGPLAPWIAVPAAALMLAWATRAREMRYRFGVYLILACVFVPFVWSLIGLVRGNHPQMVGDQALHFLLFGLYFPFRWTIGHARHLRFQLWLIPTFVLCAVSIGLWLGHTLLHLNYGIPSPILQTALARQAPGGAYRVFLKGDLFLIPAAALLWIRFSDSRRLDLPGGLGLVAVIVTSILTGTRGLWLAIAAAIVWAGYVRRPSLAWVRSLPLVVVLIGFVLVTPAAAYIQHRVSGFFTATPDVSTQIHSAEATALLSAFWQHPQIGAGLGATLTGGVIRAQDKPYLYELTYHQMLFQLGVIGTAAFLVPMVWGVIRALTLTFRPRGTAGSPGHLAAVGGASLVGIAIVSATNPYLFSAVGAVIVALALAMVEGAIDAAEGPQADKSVETAGSPVPSTKAS